MTLGGTRTFVGFGFGAIQSGLFLYEAFNSAAFRRLVVAEVMPGVVSAVRSAGGRCSVNIAYRDCVKSSQIEAIEIEDPAQEADRQRLVEAIADADEIATAVPSVDYYVSDQAGSLHRVLAAGLCLKLERGGPRAVIYTAENHNHAAEILQAHVLQLVPAAQHPALLEHVGFLNTVIGKMSQVVADPSEIKSRILETITPQMGRAFLVESFNRIMISKIGFDHPFERGIAVFEEKDDLLPFEETKLYGHNATHALMGYLGVLRGAQYMADLSGISGIIPFARAAFLEESGQALIRKYSGRDPLFTPEGYRAYADDLLERMMNPFLMDAIERVTRDTERKLGWNDRLVGTMRLALQHQVQPLRYAFGAAAALASLNPSLLDSESSIRSRLTELWNAAAPAKPEQERVLEMIIEQGRRLKDWCAAGFPDLRTY